MKVFHILCGEAGLFLITDWYHVYRQESNGTSRGRQNSFKGEAVRAKWLLWSPD